VDRLAAATRDRYVASRALEPYVNAFCQAQSARPLDV